MRLPCLYAILDLELARERALDPVALAIRWCSLGIRFIQLRAKGVSAQVAFEFCRSVSIAVAGFPGVLLVVNDRVDLCIALGLRAVHLPSHGLPSDVVRTIAPDLVIGRSCHSVEDVRRAVADRLDFVTLSPVFPPNSKPTDSRPPLGPEVLGTLFPIPVFGLGGMTFARARTAIDAGAYGAAMMGVLHASLPDAVAEEIVRLEP